MCVKQNDKYLSKILRDFCVIRARNITYIILIDCIKRNIYSKKKNIFRSFCTIIYIDLFHIYFTYNKKKVFNEHLRLFRNTPPNGFRDTVKFHLPQRIIQRSKRSIYLSNSTRGNRISREKQAVGEKSIPLSTLSIVATHSIK